ncbi:MAG: hypothetical protein ABI432_17735 [Flavobacteriales bacterium]
MPPLAKRISLSLFTTVALWAGIAVTLVRHPPGNILSWDTFGYYLYLPANLVHHDPALLDQRWVHEVVETYHSTESFYQASELPDGRWVMKYPMGLAVLWSPFFVMGHIGAGLTGHPQDGFSAPYRWSLICAMLAYALAGLLVLRRVLREFFDDGIVAAVLAIIVLGTNYLHQALYSSGMPHVFLFTLYAGVLWHSIRWQRDHRVRDVIILAFLMGLLVLSRPSEVVVIFVPLLFGLSSLAQWKEHSRDLWRWRSHLLLMVAIMLLIGAPQLIYWKWLTGKFLYMSYNNPGEGFEFLHPYLAEVLFSFRKGWYIYTPVMAVATCGLFLMRRYIPSAWLAVIVFFVLNLYIVSSWSCWWYADSFGQRALVQSYALMALPLGAFIAWLAEQRAWLRLASVMMLLTFTGLNLFQTWQSAQGLIHTSRMTEAAYRAVFGKTSPPSDLAVLLLVDRTQTVFNAAPDLRGYDRSQFVTMNCNAVGADLRDIPSLPKQGAGLLGGAHDEIPVINIPWDRVTKHDHVWVEVSCRVRYPQAQGKSDVELVATMEHNGYHYHERSVTSEGGHLDPSGWEPLTLWYMTPEVRNGSDLLKVYYRTSDEDPAVVDRVEVAVYEPTSGREP